MKHGSNNNSEKQRYCGDEHTEVFIHHSRHWLPVVCVLFLRGLHAIYRSLLLRFDSTVTMDTITCLQEAKFAEKLGDLLVTWLVVESEDHDGCANDKTVGEYRDMLYILI